MSKSIQLAPTSGAYRMRDNLKMEIKDYHGAMADFNSTITFNPRNDETYYQRARLKYAQDDKTGAMADINQAITLNSDSETCKHAKNSK